MKNLHRLKKHLINSQESQIPTDDKAKKVSYFIEGPFCEESYFIIEDFEAESDLQIILEKYLKKYRYLSIEDLRDLSEYSFKSRKSNKDNNEMSDFIYAMS